MTVYQRTLGHTLRATGVGVHSGSKVMLVIRPAPVDTGIVFRRTDLANPVDIPAKNEFVDSSINMSTALIRDGVRVGTVEHLLSALAGLGIDNAVVEINAPELPIMDGSAAPFVFLLKSAGVVEQSDLKRFVRIKKQTVVGNEDSYAAIKPYSGFKLSYELQYPHPAFKPETSKVEIDFINTSYYTAISRARTFGFLADYERVKALGYAAGSSMANSVVFDDYRVLNEGGLRYQDECARHKILDAIGDLYLMGGPVLGEFSGRKSGHALNNELTRTLLADESAWEYVTFGESAADEEDELYPNWFPAVSG